jgi:hypothetical protein
MYIGPDIVLARRMISKDLAEHPASYLVTDNLS